MGFLITSVFGEREAFRIIARDGKNEIDLFVLSNPLGADSISLKGDVIDPMSVINRVRRAIHGEIGIESLVGREF